MELKFLKFLSFLILINFSRCCNLSFKDLTTCVSYFTNDDNDYREYFNLTDLSDPERYPTELVKFNFYVIARENAHIGLLVDKKRDSKGFDITLGDKSNTYSKIVENDHRDNTLIKKDGKTDLHLLVPVHVRVLLTADKFLSVTLNNQEHLSVMVKETLPIKYVSFSTKGTRHTGDWFYNCKFNEQIEEKL